MSPWAARGQQPLDRPFDRNFDRSLAIRSVKRKICVVDQSQKRCCKEKLSIVLKIITPLDLLGPAGRIFVRQGLVPLKGALSAQKALL